jgi:amino acid adenylation domain-containing protein/non-ribosomal peptide synthase protein (TIGR01720 family)
MEDIIKQLASLSPEKRKLFIQMLKARGIDLDSIMIQPQPRDRESYPLSFAQQRLWFLEQLEPGTAMYNIPLAVRLRGQVDPDVLERSINAIVQRHETLRTVFRSHQGEPVQVILPELHIPLAIDDLREIGDEEREAQAMRLAREEARQPFDLATGPLLRVRLLQLADDDFIALLTMHHIVSDGWSMGVILRELAAFYHAFSGEQMPALPPLSIQYVDFAVWQRQWLEGERLERQLDYWKTKLAGIPALLRLPADHPRPPVQTTRGGSLSFELSPELSNQLRALARHYDVTPFMLLMAAFQVLLARYSGQDDICVGTPVANRNRSEIEPLIGFFANTLVIRGDLFGDPAFPDFLQQMKQTVIDAQAHQDVPFETLVDELEPERDMSYTPLFQVMFSFQAAATKSFKLPQLRMEQLPLDSGAVKFDLSLVMIDHPEQLRGRIAYNRDIFEHETVARMMAHFVTLLEGIARQPERPVSRLPLLSAREREQVLHAFPNARPYPADRTLVEWFQEQVARTPQGIALTFEDRHYTYQELNARANQLAHYLRSKGVGPETLVGLLLERSESIVIAILGVLKAGGAYVPIDPVYPPERMSFMLEDTAAPLLITQSSLKERAAGLDIELVLLDEMVDELARQPQYNPDSHLGPQNLAYVIYTSGSTGKPKGVLVTHANVVRLMTATEPWYHFNEKDVWTLFHSYAFDFSVWELWGPLLYGGRLVVASFMVSRSPEAFYELLLKEGVTVLNQTPSAFRQLIRAAEARERPGALSLRLVIFGGEALELQSLQPWFDMFGDEKPQLVNMYGITETTVHVTYRPIRQADLDAAPGSVIGGPIPDLELYVLDQHRQPQPFGVPGELYVGGAGVARGYLNRPALTAERFIPDPFSGRIGDRLYKTGDLARLLPGGDVEYLGRIDFQVKIRGFRVELGEIETVLDQHETVRESVVLVREDTPGDQRLVAYVVAAPGHEIDVADLRSHCQRTLPDYMVPAAIVVMDAIPLTNNGKVDRRALPAPDWRQATVEVAYVRPRTPTEEIIAAIWTQVLGVEPIGAFDNFFDRGGHSLLATQVISRLQEAFMIDLPLRVLFEHSTLADLAQVVEKALQEAQGLTLPPIEPIPRDQPLPLSFAQQRLWFLDQLEPQSPQYNIPDAVRIRGNLDVEALERSLNEIVRRHEVLRAIFPTVDGVATQIILPDLHVPLAVQDLSALPEAEREEEAFRQAQVEAKRPFDLARGPLIRTTLLKLGDEDYLFLLTMHHIVSDGWSTGVLIRELSVLYPAFAAGEPSPLPELRIQYPDFAAWQRNWLQGETLEQQLDYWRGALAGMPSTLNLPTDRPRPKVQTHTGRYFTFSLPEDLSVALKALSREADATLFMTLLAAFQAFLYRYSGQDDFGVGTPVANRNHPDLEKLIGFFVNTLVLRADLSDNPDFMQLLARVRETALGAYAHQDLPFEMLVDALQPNRNLSRSPLFQVMFMLNPATHAEALPLPGLTLSRVETETGIALFDMTLILNEGPDGISGGVEYNADLFDESTIARMMRHFQRLLEGMVTMPDRPINALPLLTEDERTALISRWRGMPIEHTDLCMHHLFEQQAQRTPDAIAVIQGDVQLTYRELDQRANRLAHHLRSLGIGPEKLVGISIRRSPEMLIGMLAILKAGGAYLPLDPGYPDERLQYMIEDAGVRIVVTDDAKRAQQFARDDMQFIAPDDPMLARYPDTPPDVAVSPANLAYVIYTSGSTGRPKGVSVTHASVVNHNLAMAELFGLTSNDRILQFSTINFDAAVEEIFPAWSRGATVVLRGSENLMATTDLTDLIRRHNISVLDFPTAYWHQWVQELSETGESVPDTVRLAAVGGEKALAGRYEAWRQLTGEHVRWLNTYGPTEGSIVVMTYDPAADPRWQPGMEIPIGRALPNVRCYVLDEGLEPTPVGVTGDLYIGGVAVARGYLNRPELTADAFIPDPFSPEPGARMYRTGDLARVLPGGIIQYAGRRDYQVKVRGFRVELGEIETALRQHEQITDAVVLARRDTATGSDALRLVAYFTPAEGAEVTGAELRRYLQSRLPEYMVPAFFVSIDKMPLTPNGKVNRRALPAPDTSSLETSAEFVPPSTEKEKLLAAVWADVLGLEKVGVNDNFFELGGDSILSIQLVSRANQSGLKISPQDIFQYPTVAQLAAVAQEGMRIQAEQGIITGQSPLTPIQRWFFEQNFEEMHHWNQSLLLEVRQKLDIKILREAIAALLAHHDALRSRFVQTDNGWMQEIVDVSDDVPLDVLDLSAIPEADRAEAIAAEASRIQAGFDLGRGPLLRVAYMRLGPDATDRLLVVTHHLASDGVSWRILMEDLQTAYMQLSQGKPVSLPPKTTSYQHWAERLAAYAQSQEGANHVDLWLQTPQVTSLYLDNAWGENTEAQAETVVSELDEESTRALLHDVPPVYRTEINDVLLTALAQAVFRWQGVAAWIGLEGHGRENLFEDVDISRTVGWFTTLFPVLLDTSRAYGTGEALKQVKEQLRTIPDHGIAFGLARYLRQDDIAQALQALPEPPIIFNYLGQADRGTPQTGLFGPAPEFKGPDRSLNAHRAHLIEVNGGISGGRLSMAWTFSRDQFRPETVQLLADYFTDALQEIIAHCQNPDAGGVTPSDFELADLDQNDLDNILGKFQ